MGVFKVKVKIKGIDREIERELIVDNGSTFTWINKDILLDLGIRPKRRKKFVLITGEKIEREVGEATIEIDGEEATVPVVFAWEHDKEVLGSTALEILGFKVDPIKKKLKKVEAFLALFS
mgnify:CR=1 FL=1